MLRRLTSVLFGEDMKRKGMSGPRVPFMAFSIFMFDVVENSPEVVVCKHCNRTVPILAIDEHGGGCFNSDSTILEILALKGLTNQSSVVISIQDQSDVSNPNSPQVLVVVCRILVDAPSYK